MKFNKEFTARKHNKYSIRKFSVGIASILVGSIFVYGQNAQAAEAQRNDDSTVQNNNEGVGEQSAPSSDVDTTSVNNNRVSSLPPMPQANSIDSESASSSNTEVQQPQKHAVSNANQPQPVQLNNQPQTRSAQPQNQAQPDQNVQQQKLQPSKPVLKQAQIAKKEISADTKEVDVFKYVEQNSKHLTENERQFFLRAAVRETPIYTREWQKVFNKEYDSVSGGASNRNVASQKVQNVKVITDALQKLIADRDKDEFYTNLRTDDRSRNSNHFTLSNNFDKDQNGQQTLKFGLSKDFVRITFPHNGKWYDWVHRFEHWGLRTNESLNDKIAEVKIKYKWHGKDYDEVLNRDSDGFYWFKEDEKHGFKGHLGGGLDFIVKLKKNAVIDKTKDAAWGYILSDAEHKNPMAVVNYAFKKFNLGQQDFDKTFNASALATLKQEVTNKINDTQRGFSTQDTSKDYYLGLLTQASNNVTTAEQYAEAVAKLTNIDKRVNTALQEVRPTTPKHRTVNANTKDVNVLKYIEENSKFLTDEERKFFLRQATRHSGFHSRDWNHIYSKNYDSISMNVNDRTIGANNVDSLNKLLTAMYELIENRNNDGLYKELTTDAASQGLNNTYTLDDNVTQNNGQQTIKVTVDKKTLQFSNYQNGSWWVWQKRFDQWGLRTNESLNKKIDKVVAKYRWNGEDKEDVLVRDNKGFYWFKEDEKFSVGKAKVGGGVDFFVTFKKDAVLDNTNDKLWGYVISDSKELETRAGANIGFGKVDLNPVVNKVNSQTVANLKQDLLNNIQTLTPVLTGVENGHETFKAKIEAVNVANLSDQQFEEVKAQIENITKEVAQATLKNNLLAVPSNKEHLGRYAKLSNDAYFLSFQALNTDPVNSLNKDGSVTLKPQGYLFYNLKTEGDLAPGKQINLTLLATNVANESKFEYAVQGENNEYIVDITPIPKTADGQYKLQNFTVPQGAKKFALRLDNRNGSTDTHVNLFTIATVSTQKNKEENLLVIPDNYQHIGNYAKYTQDGQFSSFQSFNTTPTNSFNPDGSLTLKPKGYLFYNLKAEGDLAPGKQFKIVVMANQVDSNTQLAYGFHDAQNKLGTTVTAISKTADGVYSIDNVTVPENVKDVTLRLDNRTGSSDTVIQSVFVLPKKATEV